METQTVTDWRAHYIGVRRRLAEAARRHEASKHVKAAPPPPPPPAPKARDWLHVESDPISEALAKSSVNYVRNLIAETAEKHGITVAELISESRSQRFVLARQEAAYRIRKETTWSFPRIGKVLGDRDHTTALHAVQSHEKRLREADDAQS